MVVEQSLSRLNLTILLTTALVLGVIAGILGLVLYFSGLSGAFGVAGWLAVSLVFIAIQWLISPWLIRVFSGARELKPGEAPELHEMVARLAKQANIPVPPLYFVDNSSPNAFAFGRTQSSAGIAVHSGLLKLLNKEEVEAVLAHEIAHIKHRDVFVMTLASALPVVLYYFVIMFGDSGRGRDRNAGAAIAVFLGAILARLLGQLLVLWLSRQRESFADAYSAYATRRPTHLMRALAKISYAGVASPAGGGDEVLKAFYFADASGESRKSVVEIAAAVNAGDDKKLMQAIENEKRAGALEWLMSHPLTAKRLEALLAVRKQIGG